MIQDQFPTFPFMLEIEVNLIIRIRPLDYSEGKPIITGGLGYFEYTKDNKPDDINFYKRSNPFDLDPHERNFSKDIFVENKMRIAAEKRMERRDRMLKGGGGGGGKKGKGNRLGFGGGGLGK